MVHNLIIMNPSKTRLVQCLNYSREPWMTKWISNARPVSSRTTTTWVITTTTITTCTTWCITRQPTFRARTVSPINSSLNTTARKKYSWSAEKRALKSHTDSLRMSSSTELRTTASTALSRSARTAAVQGACTRPGHFCPTQTTARACIRWT